MGRASRADAAKHRDEVVEAASHLFRERGIAAVSVPELMAAAGLTHGGFYRHFESKDALAATAVTAAFDGRSAQIEQVAADHEDDPAAARRIFLDDYLSVAHRDSAGDGCPNAGLATEVARLPEDSEIRTAYTDGLHRMASAIGKVGTGDEGEALVELSTLVGAMVLARAAAGDEISERILREVRDSLDRR
ncbi:TetR family transcriptional regulator [Amycolatopsis sp. NBC_00345]|uniref:TetR/AcrR family transcriptional regulator n=1 Tax=Amycolatopsis sp. NBC_00345 TaxID=2975955 RepID=UPI002E268DC6